LVSKEYKIVATKIKMVNMIKDSLKKFSYLRSNDVSLNLAFINAETRFMEGKYTESLNIIIKSMEEKGAV
jgi:hypothetical protein